MASSLSDDFQRQVVGVVPSPSGAITSYVLYRTKLSTYSQHSIFDLTSTIKDDHFNRPSSRNNKNVRHASGFEMADYEILHGTSPGQRTVAVQQVGLVGEGVSAARKKRAAFGPSMPDASTEACEPEPDAESDVPFAMLLKQASSPLSMHSGDMGSNEDMSILPGTGDPAVEETRLTTDSTITMKDDFVMIELQAPFVGSEEDLGKFYRDCQMAPTLSMFEQTGSLQDMIDSITDQLAQFEANAGEFNEFVSSLQEFD